MEVLVKALGVHFLKKFFLHTPWLVWNRAMQDYEEHCNINLLQIAS